MEKQKQIEELKDWIDSMYGCDCAYFGVDGLMIAEGLYNAGYRKQSDTAREIFAEIERILNATYKSIQVGCHLDMRYGNTDSPSAMIEHGKLRGVKQIGDEIINLKKKYTEE